MLDGLSGDHRSTLGGSGKSRLWEFSGECNQELFSLAWTS